MSDTPTIIEINPISIDIIKNLFCLDLPGVYCEGFSFNASFTVHQMISAVLQSNTLEKMAAEFDDAGMNPDESNYAVGCLSTPNGSCFAYARYKHNGVYNLTFMSAMVEQEFDANNKPTFNIINHSLLTGIEDEDGGERTFTPFACLCRAVIDDSENEQLIEPADVDEFYASLCYMQQSLATCLGGNDLDLLRNQCWLDPVVIGRAYEEFSKIVGTTSVEDVIQTYIDRLEMAEQLLAELEDDDDEEPPTSGYPSLKPILN